MKLKCCAEIPGVGCTLSLKGRDHANCGQFGRGCSIDVTVYHRGARFLKNLPAHRGCAQYALPAPRVAYPPQVRTKRPIGRRNPSERHATPQSDLDWHYFRRGLHGEGLLDAWSDEW